MQDTFKTNRKIKEALQSLEKLSNHQAQLIECQYERLIQKNPNNFEKPEMKVRRVTNTNETSTSNRISTNNLNIPPNITEILKELSYVKTELTVLKRKRKLEKRKWNRQKTEWQQLENDLLVAVRVANDFKDQHERRLKDLIDISQIQKNRIRDLELEIRQLNNQPALVRFDTFPGRPSVRNLIQNFEQMKNLNIPFRVISAQTLPPNSKLVFSNEFNHLNAIPTKDNRKDPLGLLIRQCHGSKRNALLKWCQQRLAGYKNIELTNFSTSWNDGLAFCALLHSYLPYQVPYEILTPRDKRTNFEMAFAITRRIGIPTILNMEVVIQERPPWKDIMAYVTAIYEKFET